MNAVSTLWTFGGSVFLLFLSELGLPMGKIGVLLSLFPFCGLLALGVAPLAARLGQRRFYLATQAMRNVVIAGLLLLPYVMASAGPRVGLLYLFSVISLFALLRSMAETAYYPWSQEFVPSEMRGGFIAWTMVAVMLTSCLALLVAGQFLATGVGMGRFLWLIGIGSLFGLCGVMAMAQVPGGRPRSMAAGSSGHFGGMKVALRDRNFQAYLGGVGGTTVGTALLIGFLPLYLKEVLGVEAAIIVRLDALVMIGGALASLVWGRLADRLGSRPVLLLALALGFLPPLGWLLLPRQAPHLVFWCACLYAAYGVLNVGLIIGSGRMLLNRVAPRERISEYMAIYYACLGVAGGVGPLLAGGLLSFCNGWRVELKTMVVDGYSLLFSLALACFVIGMAFYARVEPDGIHTTREVLRRFWTKITLACIVRRSATTTSMLK